MFAKRVGILAVVVAGSLGVPAAALAAPTLTVGDSGQIGPEGASVTVVVTYSCDPSPIVPFGTVTVQIAESTGNNKLVQANGASSTTCDGTVQTMPVVIDVPTTSSIPFKPGTATVSASLLPPVFGTDPVINVGPQPVKLKK